MEPHSKRKTPKKSGMSLLVLPLVPEVPDHPKTRKRKKIDGLFPFIPSCVAQATDSHSKLLKSPGAGSQILWIFWKTLSSPLKCCGHPNIWNGAGGIPCLPVSKGVIQPLHPSLRIRGRVFLWIGMKEEEDPRRPFLTFLQDPPAFKPQELSKFQRIEPKFRSPI